MNNLINITMDFVIKTNQSYFNLISTNPLKVNVTYYKFLKYNIFLKLYPKFFENVFEKMME